MLARHVLTDGVLSLQGGRRRPPLPQELPRLLLLQMVRTLHGPYIFPEAGASHQPDISASQVSRHLACRMNACQAPDDVCVCVLWVLHRLEVLKLGPPPLPALRRGKAHPA